MRKLEAEIKFLKKNGAPTEFLEECWKDRNRIRQKRTLIAEFGLVEEGDTLKLKSLSEVNESLKKELDNLKEKIEVEKRANE
ncbi:MAG: hypothetical protein U5L45_20935 [Saprospiraceae bacterium]|nr:hypothetical protein [Saprospiraceae bacterium]